MKKIISTALLSFVCVTAVMSTETTQEITKESVFSHKIKVNEPDEVIELAAREFAKNIKVYKELAIASKLVYEDNPNTLSKLYPSFEFAQDAYVSSKGLYIRVGVDEKDKAVLVLYRGTELSNLDQWLANISQALSGDSELYREAVSFTKSTKDKYQGYSFTLAGHSLGGGLAMHSALAINGVDAYTFNLAFPNSYGIQNRTIQRYTEGLAKGGMFKRSNITNLIVEGDEIENMALFRFLGLPGAKYILSHHDVKKNSKRNHYIDEVIHKLERLETLGEAELRAVGRSSYAGRGIIQ
ncbi:lipase family protein [Vibrio parahaemolyticus]|uniref:lipase family protein n=3 Tax=Vibrio parahaemolyticus TaxID=670 RepID=UPI0003FC7F4F|nr:Mbeg1-like protein [Vibrio parahaemolyticus]MDL2044735.1 DUF2974 domain-containing protein [Vibrio parahaemolyticus]HCG7482137.1 DUF2974 domain-containing protein [Vibrio parahaemolyticus]HCH2618813.1 DUF2974 domain-containing protein [Vibrio parahaemolyticus]HCH6235756.1 DUF2974 domain-containing protein [Vibrio parahaemolyticus]HCM1465429.1 DUF2974 domain-containing protein [Vibrio parahaemolyticus]